MTIDLEQGDCLELMKRIQDKSIDMILCDLPYGLTRNEWDVKINLDELWIAYKRIIKDNGVIALFANQPFASELVNSNLKMFRYEWVFEKGSASGFLNSHKMPLKAHEIVLIFYKKLPKYNPQFEKGEPYTRPRQGTTSNYGNFERNATISDGRRYPRDVVKLHTSETGLHPTQKPVKWLEYLIKTYTDERDLVLDNCMGSGSTGVACKNTNRSFIGYELNKEYFEIAKERIIEDV